MSENLRRYYYGILIGMFGEYLLRVEFNYYALSAIILFIIGMTIDLLTNKTK